jgi:DNA (cytosine-5)-methyltransferase 1
MSSYYNEFDPYAAAWLRELIKAKLIPDGHVDTRSITEVQPSDLAGFRQHHFFAGIGGWAYALRLAGWPDERPVWTASCPCQPFSVGSVGHGGAKGQGDPRHLWPVFFPLVRKYKPSVVFGEQVASAIGWGWLDEAAMDFESENFSFGASVLRADAIGADHQRRRFYWVADSCGERRERYKQEQCVSVAEKAPFPINGNPLIRARRALDGDFSDLLPCDGLSVTMERCALKGYGNAIVPQVAAEFIKAYLDIES